jgi:hypothetical protein
MSKGSYRGGSTLTGWNANGYVPASRRLKGKGRTAQSKAESAARDELVRKRHGLTPRNLVAKDEAKVEAKQNLRKKSRTTAPVVVKVKRKVARKPAPSSAHPGGSRGPS